jgi:hypothetical protein
MKNKHVPFDLALELKHLGFREETNTYYLKSDTELKHEGHFVYPTPQSIPIRFATEVGDTIDWNEPSLDDEQLLYSDYVSAPLYQEAFYFLRNKILTRVQNSETDYFEGMFTLLPLIYFNKYEIHLTPPSTSVFPDQFGEMIPYYQFPSTRKVYTANAKTYEEAEHSCLIKLIEIIKNK